VKILNDIEGEEAIFSEGWRDGSHCINLIFLLIGIRIKKQLKRFLLDPLIIIPTVLKI